MHPSTIFSIAFAGLVSASPVAFHPEARAATALFQPKAGDSWNIVLSREIDASSPLTPNVAIIDVDAETYSKDTISKLKQQGKKVICYFSAGSSEPDREDFDILQNHEGNTVPGFEDEHYVDVRDPEVREVQKQRIARFADKGCDALDPDNVDAFETDNGLGLTKEDAVDFVKFLSTEAKAKGLSIGLKNSGKIVNDVLDFVAFSVQEECEQQGDCVNFEPFIRSGKPVFNIEYVDAEDNEHPARCPTNAQFSSIIKNLDLDGFIQTCDGQEFETDVFPE